MPEASFAKQELFQGAGLQEAIDRGFGDANNDQHSQSDEWGQEDRFHPRFKHAQRLA